MKNLNTDQIQQFVSDGFIELKNVFSPEIAREGRRILWSDLDCDPNDRNTWKYPVVRLGDYDQLPFRKAVDNEILTTAFDQLVGKGNWKPRQSLGTFPIRFPHQDDPGDTGWHVDGGFPGRDPDDYLQWRINLESKGRALLMLFLFSDVGEDDAPTRIWKGSHLEVAHLLKSVGEGGLTVIELANKLKIPRKIHEITATGKAGTVYLCHPFLVHAAQAHRGQHPRFLAQPPLLTRTSFQLFREDTLYVPVEVAIRKGAGI